MAASTLEIVFVGLCMFIENHGTVGKTVVLPDLSGGASVVTPRGPTCVEPHTAFIAAPKTTDVTCSSCVVINDRQVMFLQGDSVTIEGMTDSGWNALPFEVPAMSTICPRFRPRIPQTATTMRLTSGTLRGRKRQEEWQAVLTVERDSSVAIVARNGNRIRTMELAASVPSVTIGNVYANSGELGVEQRPLADNHWLAFYTLAGMPVLCDVPVPPNPSPNRRDPHAHTTIACSVSQYP